MNITFDHNKDAINQTKHGISLADAEQIEWNGIPYLQHQTNAMITAKKE